MAEIKLGYDNKLTELRVQPTSGVNLELRIKQKGLIQITGGRVKRSTIKADGKILDEHDDLEVGESETLAYMTLNEAVSLIFELQDAVREIVSGNNRR